MSEGRYGAALPGWARAGMLFHHWQGHVLRHTLHGGRPGPRTVHRSHNEVVGDKERPTKIVWNCTRVPGLLLAHLLWGSKVMLRLRHPEQSLEGAAQL